MSNYAERAANYVTKVQKDFLWENAGNPYIKQVVTNIEPGTAGAKQSKSTQTLDAYGNVTQSKQYDFGLSEATARTYNSTYLTGSNWTNRYIRNRLKSSTITANGVTKTLVTNHYDNESVSGCVINTIDPINDSSLKNHNSAEFGTGF